VPTDLLAFTPVRNPASWRLAWRAHPGGSILTLAGFGDVLVVTTSERRIVGYTATGIRLWQLSLEDLAPTPVVRASDRELVFVDLSGVVRKLEIRTGRVIWRRDLRTDVNVAPAVGSGVAVIMDRGGTTTGVDLGSGSTRWEADLLGVAAAVVGETAVVLQDQTAVGLAINGGRRRWRRPFAGTYTAVGSVGDATVLATKSETVVVGPRGDVRARLEAGYGLTGTNDGLVIWGQRTALLVDATGTVRSQWGIPPLTNITDARPGVALPDGVLLFGAGWPFSAWSR
jgi:outer membrane protein assembly factor BamB